MERLRHTELKFVKGIGERRADLLRAEHGISSAWDLLHLFPHNYVDRSKFYTLRELRGCADSPAVQVRGRFLSFNVQGEGAKMRLIGLFSDGTATMEVTWFRSIKTVRRAIDAGREYILFGKPSMYMSTLQMVHPEVEVPKEEALDHRIRGVYPSTERITKNHITSRVIGDAVAGILARHPGSLGETLPPSTIADNGLMPLDRALREIHFPSDNDSLQAARLRLKFEELFYIQTDMLRRSRRRKALTEGYLMPNVGEWFNRFYTTCLPFELTGAQKRVIKEVRADLISGRQMNRLVQGDVGSGKTLVAMMVMLLAIDNGYQATMMAPTEILATQHYETLSGMGAKIGLNIRLLTGSTRTRERREIDQGLADGTIHILVGTHALLEDHVQFHNLGIAVIDEQHRFGVAQRARLWAKNVRPPHVLVMTATPIPRTLAMTVYGDLEVSVIDELPPGRKPITTLLRYDDQRQQVFRGIGHQLAQGHRAYIVYPLIEENEKLDLQSLNEGYEAVCEAFPHYRVAFVHGRLKPSEKDYQMGLFASGEAQILVATTVIEVGVNVPSATTMVIENAERFGLSQLHQLRGRVGRGADRSYCILMTRRDLSRDSRQRLQVIADTTDGFAIAEADMKFRGPGDIEGTMQSGMPFQLRLANLATDGQIISMARHAAERLLDNDPDLTQPKNQAFARALEQAMARTADWSRIS